MGDVLCLITHPQKSRSPYNCCKGLVFSKPNKRFTCYIWDYLAVPNMGKSKQLYQIRKYVTTNIYHCLRSAVHNKLTLFSSICRARFICHYNSEFSYFPHVLYQKHLYHRQINTIEKQENHYHKQFLELFPTLKKKKKKRPKKYSFTIKTERKNGANQNQAQDHFHKSPCKKHKM